MDWELIAKRMPTGRDKASHKKRRKIFKAMDVNGNGILSLAEVDKGIRDVLAIP